MKKMLGFLLCTSAMFGAAASDVKNMKVEQCGAFDISIPTGPRGEVGSWAWKVNRFEALEGTGREAGWIVVAAKSDGFIKVSACMQLATNMPNNVPNAYVYGLGSPGCILQKYITVLNTQFSEMNLTDAVNINPDVVSSLAVLMKYGNSLVRAFGKQAEDQSNWVPDVQCEEIDFPTNGDITFAIADDNEAPMITWVRERAGVDGIKDAKNPLISLFKSIIS